MGTTDDILKAIFSQQAPSQDDINAAPNLDWLSQVDPEKAKEALSGLNMDELMPKGPIAPPEEPASSFDVHVSDNTATQDGQVPAVPPAPAAPPINVAAPEAPAPEPVSPTPTTPSAPAPQGKSPAAPVPSSVASAPSDADSAAREALREKEAKDQKLGVLPVLGAGLADAAAGASNAYGNNMPVGAVDKVLAQEKDIKAQNRADLEKKLKDDPNSDVSKQYQKVLGLMLNKPVTDPMIAGRTANQIAETLPEVDKFMQKELQIQAIKSNKELQLSMMNQNRQDKLEQQYRTSLQKELSNRSGGLGLQDQKVNAAIHARQLLEGARNPQTGEIDLNQVATPELALTLSNLVSGNSNASVETFKSMSPQSLQQDIKSKVGYLFGKPVAVLPKAWVDTLSHMVDRQGLTSEQLRDHYIDGLKSQRPTDLDAARAAALEREELGNSYADTFGLQRLPPVKGGHGATPAVPAKPSAPNARITKLGTSYTVE